MPTTAQGDHAAVSCFLVDWDNVIGSAGLPLSGIDLRIAASLAVLPAVVGAAASFAGATGTGTANLMLYGGWTMSSGRASKLADALGPALRRNRRLVSGIAVRPTLRTTSLALNGIELVGLMRMGPPRQKMVDTILALDTVFVARRLGVPVCVVSEDDDLVPAVAEASTHADSGRVHLMRAGQSHNRHVLDSTGVQVTPPPSWA